MFAENRNPRSLRLTSAGWFSSGTCHCGPEERLSHLKSAATIKLSKAEGDTSPYDVSLLLPHVSSAFTPSGTFIDQLYQKITPRLYGFDRRATDGRQVWEVEVEGKQTKNTEATNWTIQLSGREILQAEAVWWLGSLSPRHAPPPRLASATRLHQALHAVHQLFTLIFGRLECQLKQKKKPPRTAEHSPLLCCQILRKFCELLMNNSPVPANTAGFI